MADHEIKAVVLTISDRCSRGETKDSSGPAVVRLLEDKLSARIYNTEVIPDHQVSDVQCMHQDLPYECRSRNILHLVVESGAKEDVDTGS